MRKELTWLFRLGLLAAVVAISLATALAAEAGAGCCQAGTMQSGEPAGKTEPKQCSVQVGAASDETPLSQTYWSDEAALGDEVICPVSGKRIIVTQATHYELIGGRRYYVCCRACGQSLRKEPDRYLKDPEKIRKTEAEWKSQLTPEQYRITREKGTEMAFTGEYLNNKKKGTYRCVACGQPLFGSQTKYDSGSGWPSFTAPLGAANVEEKPDRSHGRERVEVLCSRCEAHLGHVFEDGPEPTGLRYCINSAALDFEEETEKP